MVDKLVLQGFPNFTLKTFSYREFVSGVYKHNYSVDWNVTLLTMKSMCKLNDTDQNITKLTLRSLYTPECYCTPEYYIINIEVHIKT